VSCIDELLTSWGTDIGQCGVPFLWSHLVDEAQQVIFLVGINSLSVFHDLILWVEWQEGVSDLLKSSVILQRILCSMSQKNNTLEFWSANVDRFSKFFHYQIPKKAVYELLQGLPPHLNYVATLLWKFKNLKKMIELLLIPSKFISFTWNFTKLNNMNMTNATKISEWWFACFLCYIWSTGCR